MIRESFDEKLYVTICVRYDVVGASEQKKEKKNT